MLCVGQHVFVFFFFPCFDLLEEKKNNSWKCSCWVHRNVWSLSCSYYFETFAVAVFTWICGTEHRFLCTQVLVFMKQFAVIPCLPQNMQPIWWEAERRQFQTHHVVSLKDGKEDRAEWSRSWKKSGKRKPRFCSWLGDVLRHIHFMQKLHCRWWPVDFIGVIPSIDIFPSIFHGIMILLSYALPVC